MEYHATQPKDLTMPTKPRRPLGYWTIGALDDGSGLWLGHYQAGTRYTEHSPDGTLQADGDVTFDSRSQCVITARLARLILKTWRKEREI